MIALHKWPKPVKRLVLTGATLLVIVAYASLCIVAWMLATVLASA
jgi:hypothetical protein